MINQCIERDFFSFIDSKNKVNKVYFISILSL